MYAKKHLALSKISAIIILIIIIIAAAGGIYYFETSHYHHAVTKVITLAPPNPNELTDVAQTAPPDALDPATGFFVQDGPLFTAVFQELVEFNGSNYHEVVPVIAENYTTPNYQNYYFYLRQCIHFSDGVQVNASTVWFSLYRTILMGQGPGVANYIGLLFNSTVYAVSGYAIPWGVCYAIENATGLHTVGNYTLTAEVLASILSHFNANNATIQKIMSYPNQAIVVKGPYEVEINTLEPYRYLPLVLAGWWGAIVNPVCVDMHGGVVPNSVNSYINEHGMNGTGPYVIVKVCPGFSTIELEANPNYWAVGKNVPAVAEPAHIKYIIIDYGLTHNDRVEDFVKNKAQISYISIPYLSQILGTPPYNEIPENATFVNFGAEPGVLFIAMNTQKFPTNITNFRLAIEHAINYSALLSIFSYNGKPLACEFLGPISPECKGYYDPANLSMYNYDPSLAMHYLNEAGYIGDFYVVLPNGTVLGNPSGTQLPPLSLYALAPVNELEQDELEVISHDLSQIGIATTVYYVLPSVIPSFNTPNDSPQLLDLGWFPDWPDPVFQELMPITDIEFGAIDHAWFNCPTLQSMYNTLPFITNVTLQEELTAKAYSIIYNEAPYVWLPVPDDYFLVQPYIHCFQYNEFVGYYYNMMYYSNYTYTT
ncbi:ABC transporter substrate-binding protein [Acidianus ambivalens]|uniref:ABC transporter substrate-binding protein n=2 Tax=Acidianus ambivalens TaxID=2283 RepID=A0A650CZ99_ACIAM|nr:ABC transporter substrate-binding protein [Acidianus ambivalens]MQL54335.1 ABC transporter substrate-binding protein [Acidianus ambivalens]QGR22907.1 ABC transporter substrate-binding protein [Acidianus ambivalens]